MKKLIILIGISGSGKSTWAIKKGLQNPKYTKIVSRDVIREGNYIPLYTKKF